MRRRPPIGLAGFLLVATALALAAGGRAGPTGARRGAVVPGTSISSLSTTDQTSGMPPSAIDQSAIPLGTDKGSSTLRVGYLYRCGGTPKGGPPVSEPPWVDTSRGTWNAAAKAAVAGAVTWKASFTAVREGMREVLTGNGLPPQSGTFPVASSDPAHAYNPDPSSISAHAIHLSLPYDPKVARRTTCEGAIVGIAIDGIPILDGFDAGGYDAAAIETQDRCHGHPNTVVGYHYHGLSPCLLTSASRTHTTQVGWALDGFGIYVEYDRQGRLLTDADLDGCHGRTSVVPWHGRQVRIYHYDMTVEFPYSVGCFRGTPVSSSGLAVSSARGGGKGGPGGGGPGQGGGGKPGGGQGGPPGGGRGGPPNGGPPPGGGPPNGGPPPGGG